MRGSREKNLNKCSFIGIDLSFSLFLLLSPDLAGCDTSSHVSYSFFCELFHEVIPFVSFGLKQILPSCPKCFTSHNN